jgi:hypothetical protein
MRRALLFTLLLAACGVDSATTDEAVSVPATTLASGLGQPFGLAGQGDSLFWIDGDAKQLLRIAKTGGPITVLATGADTRSPWSVAADATDVYWLDAADATVRRTPRAGGPTAILATAQPSQGLAGLALDGTSVYFSTYDDQGHGVIRRVSKWGGPVQTLATAVDPTTIVVDAWFVYYADASVLGGTNTIARVPKLGGTPIVISRDEDALGLAADADDLYWKRFWTGDVRRGSKWIAGATTLAPDGGGWGDLAVDATNVWWTTGPLLHRSSKLGGGDEVVYQAPSWALSLEVDGGGVFLALERTSEDVPDGAIVEVAP